MPKTKELAFKRIPLKPETVRRLKHYNADHDTTYDESINLLLNLVPESREQQKEQQKKGDAQN